MASWPPIRGRSLYAYERAGVSLLAGDCYVLCPLWVKSRHSHRKKPCPLYPQKRTCAAQLEMSALGQWRTSETSGTTKRVGPSPVLVLRAAERNQNANYEVQA